MERLQVGDQVVVVAGNHKGRKGKVTKLIGKTGRVVVEGVNIVKRHVKAQAERPGGILEVEAPLAVSNVMAIDPESGEATRVRFEERDGKKVRIAAKSGQEIPSPRAGGAKE